MKANEIRGETLKSVQCDFETKEGAQKAILEGPKLKKLMDCSKDGSVYLKMA